MGFSKAQENYWLENFQMMEKNRAFKKLETQLSEEIKKGELADQENVKENAAAYVTQLDQAFVALEASLDSVPSSEEKSSFQKSLNSLKTNIGQFLTAAATNVAAAATAAATQVSATAQQAATNVSYAAAQVGTGAAYAAEQVGATAVEAAHQVSLVARSAQLGFQVLFQRALDSWGADNEQVMTAMKTLAERLQMEGPGKAELHDTVEDDNAAMQALSEALQVEQTAAPEMSDKPGASGTGYGLDTGYQAGMPGALGVAPTLNDEMSHQEIQVAEGFGDTSDLPPDESMLRQSSSAPSPTPGGGAEFDPTGAGGPQPVANQQAGGASNSAGVTGASAIAGAAGVAAGLAAGGSQASGVGSASPFGTSPLGKSLFPGAKEVTDLNSEFDPTKPSQSTAPSAGAGMGRG